MARKQNRCCYSGLYSSRCWLKKVKYSSLVSVHFDRLLFDETAEKQILPAVLTVILCAEIIFLFLLNYLMSLLSSRDKKIINCCFWTFSWTMNPTWIPSCVCKGKSISTHCRYDFIIQSSSHFCFGFFASCWCISCSGNTMCWFCLVTVVFSSQFIAFWLAADKTLMSCDL